MKNQPKSLLLACAALVGLMTANNSVQAQYLPGISPLKVRDMSYRMHKQADKMLQKVDKYFQGVPQYKHLRHDVEVLHGEVRWIESYLQQPGCVFTKLRYIRPKLRRLVGLCHHLRPIVHEAGRTGQIHPAELSHVQLLISRIEDKLRKFSWY